MKAKVMICGRQLVIDSDALDRMLELAYTAGETYEEKWHRGKDGGDAFYTHHIYEIDPSKFNFSVEMLSEAQYQMFKLAGKPN